MTVLDGSVTVRLSTAMRDGSAAEHEAAEGSAFLTELLGGRLRAAGYIAYLRRLRLVYAALEEAVRATTADPLVATVADPGLERLGAIEADLAFWTGEQVAPGTGGEIDSAAAHAYAERLRQAAATWGGTVVAHHYTRYLGDLSGGRVIGTLLERTFDLRGGGVAFYSFALVPKPKRYKDAYRARLDDLPLTGPEVDRVVDEVKVAFTLNQALLTELGGRLEEYRR
ncbi:biliverdin-producing heme oxygenase [Nocardioides sp. AX2bis]|uniref:biliverdin-producing heme oxygenase n=1 Tax=Nocardioides sp. AX2bis TaxID=2653157 RepID=UPI0012F10EB6|nr:biliverdin-producing heme oxygenase [Nocardioides sp. AX2bis]VXC48295.1 Heme oxygenase [Nocardioides sp. AX2bis]